MENIRNFSIIAHIDHGKSTLADRFLEITKTIPSQKMKPQFLDLMDLERERGITIKMKPVRMAYNYKGKDYILNLIDTPGHVDFSYEVSRSLAAVEGTILLVDATKGVQAQTLANLDLAKEQNLIIIPVINKIDLDQARVKETKKEVSDLLNINENEILEVSAKSGINVEKILERIIEKVPPPPIENISKPFRALIFDSKYDSYKGVIAYVRIVDGELKKGTKIKFLAGRIKAEAKEVGYFNPDFSPQNKIISGEIGYIATGIKEPGLIKIGDTIVEDNNIEASPLPGYKEVKPMVFASLYPQNSNDFELLKDALSKLKLNDPALTFEQETKEALGRGFRCGFLGSLHAEIISERLSREFNLDLIISTPSVVYKIIDKNDKEKFIYSPSDWPDASNIKICEEPWVLLEIITPLEYSGAISEILKNITCNYLDTKYLSFERIILVYETPLSEIINNLYDKIKSASKGFASMNYKFLEYRKRNLVKMEIFIAGSKEEAFSKIVPEDKAFTEGKNLVKKIKEFLPPQQFSVAIQAVVNGKVIARETVKALRKDVTGYLYGGDYSRKRKLLEKQKKGKKELKEKGKVKVPYKTFLEIFRKQ
ncbi:MAG TPA: translation elongation factor 4 [Candidatus Pacearchaeota archaeon]|nr:translation elongation factor 4 [Candidatus Pacearchaeota archaeon]